MLEIDLQLQGVDLLQARLNRFLRSPLGLLEHDVGEKVKQQTQKRIATEKKTPNGQAWKPWSPRYAASNRHGSGLLYKSGALHDSITATQQGGDVIVGSNLVYAAVHNFGYSAKNIPARQYIGMPEGNSYSDLVDIANDWVDSHLGGGDFGQVAAGRSWAR